ncbi:probable ERG26 - C-3 sterol dehydrogenase (C-4 decarboxylase) [Moesziomyces antarcticus]|uniref:Probable ERG26 - C-3 sterol dehydrogenase (C-4 decarboxylase) n=1 Tax=Pseudozyma antarctica TaxID=84753 RepID=A0A5C3FS02_PSEA2|nr:probable ERG26 - C-3 sterol dehydrogenase (C-4 decarboxylase) [Moesziomyces antarcticus]
MSTSPASGEAHFVIGGSGFLGSRIALALRQRGEKHVAVFDLHAARQPIEKVDYYTGDITSESSLRQALIQLRDKAGIEAGAKRGIVIYHTASPVAGLGPEIYHKVNVVGTQTVIAVAQKSELAVTKLVFTSSAGVVYDGRSLVNVDERLAYPKKPLDAYNDTKAKAEALVLQANSNEPGKLKTVALRPAGIFGIGDRQALPGFFNVLRTGKTKFQIGDNENLFDWTYVDNVVHAHLLAADKLEGAGYPAHKLGDIMISTRVVADDEVKREREVPTSEARDDTPAGSTDYARKLPSTLSPETLEHELNVRPVIRNRYDQFFHMMNPEVPSAGNPLGDEFRMVEESVPVAGEAFFITNGQPMPFWDFPRALWAGLGHVVTEKDVWKISKDWGLTLAGWAETFSWLTGRESQFTRYKVTYSASARYYNIEKARRALGYQPIVSVEEGIRRSVEWWKSEHPEDIVTPKA